MRKITILVTLIALLVADLSAQRKVDLRSMHQLKALSAEKIQKTEKYVSGVVKISHDDAMKKVSGIYDEFRKKQDQNYISEFDRETAKYLKGE